MKVTTLRFGADLWRLVETEAQHAGVSASQYVREAALARAAAGAAARGQGPYGLLSGALNEVMRDETDPATRREVERVLAGLARLVTAETRSEAGALRAEGEQARVRHKQVHKASTAALRPRTKG